MQLILWHGNHASAYLYSTVFSICRLLKFNLHNSRRSKWNSWS